MNLIFLFPKRLHDYALATTEEQVLFNRYLAAVTAVLAGMGVSKVAHAYGMGTSPLSRLVRRTKELGQIACVPYGTYHRERALHPELQQLIRKLYTQPIRPSVMAIYEDVQLKQLAEELSEREHKQIAAPTYKQVWCFLKEISQQTPVIDARSGLKHLPHERMSPKSFVLSIASPALICQVDEHTMDLLVVTPDGIVITSRVHGAVLICVKTAAILGAVLSLDALREAYCTELLGQRMSIWEAQALRKSEREQAKDAEAVSLQNRQRIQQEAGASRHIHSPSDKAVRETTTDGPPAPGSPSRTGPGDVTCACPRAACSSFFSPTGGIASAGHPRR